MEQKLKDGKIAAATTKKDDITIVGGGGKGKKGKKNRNQNKESDAGAKDVVF